MSSYKLCDSVWSLLNKTQNKVKLYAAYKKAFNMHLIDRKSADFEGYCVRLDIQNVLFIQHTLLIIFYQER